MQILYGFHFKHDKMVRCVFLKIEHAIVEQGRSKIKNHQHPPKTDRGVAGAAGAGAAVTGLVVVKHRHGHESGAVVAATELKTKDACTEVKR